jgi:hypothetical protein
LLILGSVVAAGCAPAPEEAIAAKIEAANSPLVREVDYQPANMLDPAEIDVWLRSDATEAQANAFWCDVVLPAGGQLQDVALWDSTGATYVSVHTGCGAPPS